MDLTPNSTQDGVITLDLSGCGLRKLERSEKKIYQCLVVDRNELSRLENVETYGDLYKLSASENKLVRMYSVCRLVHLRVLNLSKNCIVAIEGLRELISLCWLNLSGNKLKTVEHLTTNVGLEHLDLSNNCICSMTDISNLKLLQTLLLDYNNLKTLGGSTSYFPRSLVTLSLTNNSISDLNQLCHLGRITRLEQLSINDNPCISMTGNALGFDYRPFVVNWCQTLKLLDGFVVTSKESLKAEWLYSMGKGRHFHMGEHIELVDYLSGVCPLTKADNTMSEEDAKLTRILSKRHQHQKQLLAERAITSSAMTPSAPSALSSVPTSKAVEDVHHEAGQQRTCSWVEEDSVQPLLILSPPEAPSDVPDLGHDSDVDVDAQDVAASSVSLCTETQYVPVPETLVSPDFRPLSVPPQLSIFDVAAASSSEDLMTRSWESATFPRWLQRSFIPKSTSPRSQRPSADSSIHKDSRTPNRRSYPSLTDSPILRRPAQVQRLQRSSRPVSLSPSNTRRPPSSASSSNRSSTAKADGSSVSGDDDDSSDSDVSLSKLSIVKEAAQLLHSAAAAARQGLKPTVGRAKKPKVVPVVAKKKAEKRPTTPEHVDLHCSQMSQQRAACIIQAMWRGHRVRNHNVIAGDVRREMRLRRAEDHVHHLVDKLSNTQLELENEKRLRALMMEAIRSLWKEVQNLQATPLPSRDAPSDRLTTPVSGQDPERSEIGHVSTKVSNGTASIEDGTQRLVVHLVATCDNLQAQVKQLQEAVNTISRHLTGYFALKTEAGPLTNGGVIHPEDSKGASTGVPQHNHFNEDGAEAELSTATSEM